MLACNLPSALLSLIRPLSDRPEHRELMLNITRVLSKLSLYEGIRASINEDPAHLRSAARTCVHMRSLAAHGIILGDRTYMAVGFSKFLSR